MGAEGGGDVMSSGGGMTQISADLATIKLQLRAVYIRWCVSGPTLEASSAMAAMAQEEAGHARVLQRLSAAATPSAAAAAILPAEEIQDWPSLVGTVGPVEIALAGLLSELRAVEEPEFQRNLGKIAVEDRYHADFFIGCFEELDVMDNQAGKVFATSLEASEARVAGWLQVSRPAGTAAGCPLPGRAELSSSADESGRSVLGVACVHCGATDARMVSRFGSSLMTSLLHCNGCGEQFEAVRWL
jgi:hypothetical protein